MSIDCLAGVSGNFSIIFQTFSYRVLNMIHNDHKINFSFILAAGKGSRMGSDTMPKVCFPINGIPAIQRALSCYEASGIKQHLVVVGTLAGQVIDCVTEKFPNTLFAYQRQANGTANAIRAALNAFPEMDPDANLLIAAGDRLIDPAVLENFYELYFENNCDIALLSLPGNKKSSGGRVILDSYDQVIAIVERADIRQRETFRQLRSYLMNW